MKNRLWRRWACAFSFPALLLATVRPAPAEPLDPCDLNSAREVVECALERHPDILISSQVERRDREKVAIARQRPNPELDTRILGGKSADDSLLTTETTLFTVWELGGKRQARIQAAQAQGKTSRDEVLSVRERVLLETVLNLHRLRQLRVELAYLNETISTFDKITRLYRARPFLTPEQEVSLASFELAREDYRLQKSRLVLDEMNLTGSLRIATQSPLNQLQALLPPAPRRWPDLAAPFPESVGNNAALQRAASQVAEAEAALSLEKAQAWPDLRVGPTVETESLSSSTKTTAGLHVAVPLPFLNRNQGGQAFARAEEARARNALELTTQKTNLERRIQVSRYQAARKALAHAPSPGGLNSRHEKVEAFFAQGLVPSSLVLEVHRQINEVTRVHHEQELAALEALWRVYLLDGVAFSEKLTGALL